MVPPVSGLRELQVRCKEMGARMELLIMETQSEVYRTLAHLDHGAAFTVDRWERKEGEDQLDGLEGEMSPSQMTEIEAELIKERLCEIRLCMEEQGTMSKEDFNRIQAVRAFIHSNHDLQTNLQEDMQNLEDLIQKLNSQEQLVKETEEVRCEQKSDQGCPSEKRKRTV